MYEQNSTAQYIVQRGTRAWNWKRVVARQGGGGNSKWKLIRALRRWWPHLFDICSGGESGAFPIFPPSNLLYTCMQMRKEREGGKGGVGSEEDVGKLTKCEHDSSLILFAAQGHFDRIHFGRSNENPFDILFTKRICRQRKLALNTIIKPPQQAQRTAGEARRGAVG